MDATVQQDLDLVPQRQRSCQLCCSHYCSLMLSLHSKQAFQGGFDSCAHLLYGLLAQLPSG